MIAWLWFGCVATPELVDPEGTEVARPFPQHQAPLLGELALDAEARDRAIVALWQRWVDNYVEVWTADDGLARARVTMGGPSEPTVSEGQGYGLLITVWMAGYDPGARARFDALWRYVVDHPSDVQPGLMDWHVPASERPEPGDDDSAFDGDADIALALWLADAQWGSDGAIDYAAEAQAMTDAILLAEIDTSTHQPRLGDWVDPADATYGASVRTSDWQVTNFVVFGATAPEFARVADVSVASAVAVAAEFSPQANLWPDFLLNGEPAPPEFLEASTDGDWSYNAGRVPWRIGLHAALTGDASAGDLMGRTSAWARETTGGDPANLASGYSLEGVALADANYPSACFVGPIAVAAMFDDNSDWRDATFEWTAASDVGYFEDTVGLLSLLAASGNAWAP